MFCMRQGGSTVVLTIGVLTSNSLDLNDESKSRRYRNQDRTVASCIFMTTMLEGSKLLSGLRKLPANYDYKTLI